MFNRYHFTGKKMASLNRTERMIADYIGKKRYEYNRANHVAISKIGPQPHEQIELNGAGAELAFCKIHNVYPPLDIVLPAPAYDAVLNGYRIDVKTTVYPTGRLLVEVTKLKYLREIDYFALMVGDFPEYWLIGYMRAKNIMVESRIKDLGRGPTFLAEQNELWPDLPQKELL